MRFARRARRAVFGGVAVFTLITVFGCRPVHAVIVANRSTDQFLPTTDPRVFYERGAEEKARAVVEALPAAVATVEEKMTGPFAIPVRVYVCATIDTFTYYGASDKAGGLTTNHRVFISPKPENTVERMPRLLAHELSHLHLGQDRGLVSFAALPVWFVEGLGVEVSSGGGAEGVSEDDARRAIGEGHSFVPNVNGNVWSRKGASAFHLPEHMFYRQAGMFVSYARSFGPAKFTQMLSAVERGVDLDDAYRSVYGFGVAEMWQRFIAEKK
jgi:hypothetical protein